MQSALRQKPACAENTLASLGVLLGNESGDFAPQSQLTRAELVSMMVQAMGYWCWESQGSAPFTDVTAEDWYATVVDIAYNLGLIQGDETGAFRDISHPITPQARKQLEDAVLQAYEQYMAEHDSQAPAPNSEEQSAQTARQTALWEQNPYNAPNPTFRS